MADIHRGATPADPQSFRASWVELTGKEVPSWQLDFATASLASQPPRVPLVFAADEIIARWFRREAFFPKDFFVNLGNTPCLPSEVG